VCPAIVKQNPSVRLIYLVLLLGSGVLSVREEGALAVASVAAALILHRYQASDIKINKGAT
jgi:hypothetical protein